MNIYKIIFAENEIICCNLLIGKLDFKGDYYYRQESGHLIHAVIKAKNEDRALSQGQNIITEFTPKKKP